MLRLQSGSITLIVTNPRNNFIRNHLLLTSEDPPPSFVLKVGSLIVDLSTLGLGKAEDRVVQSEQLRVEVEVILGDVVGSDFVRYHWFTPVLVFDVWGCDYTLIWATDVAVRW
jgi:hypothetical protein